MSDDAGLECTEVQIATAAHLHDRGLHFRGAYAVCLVRRDGEHVDVVCATLAGVANLVAELNPQRVGLSVAPDEDHDRMLDAICGRSRDPCTTLH